MGTGLSIGRLVLKRPVPIILIISMLMSTTGCEALRKKFTRKKKAKPVRPMFYKEEEGEAARPPVELYITHYVYWETWMDDLIANAGKNKKRDKRAATEAIGNLMDMKKYLSDEKKEEIQGYIDKVSVVTEKMLAGSVSKSRMGKLKQDLDRVRRVIVRKFYYKKVKDHIVTN